MPATPLLVPEVASGAAPELDELRSAALAAVRSVLAAEPTEIVVIGPAPRTGPYPVAATWSFAGFGVPRSGGLAGDDGQTEEVLPAALSVGRWLLAHAGEESAPVQAFGITADDEPNRCQDLGLALAARTARVGVVVVGDGSACRGPKAPGSFDDRAEAFDDAWIAALAGVDCQALAQVDASLAAELLVCGRAPWQVAAAMAGGIAPGGLEAGGLEAGDLEASDLEAGEAAGWDAELLHHEDPYGVMYAVATWLRRPT